jgi:hypothetical protein
LFHTNTFVLETYEYQGEWRMHHIKKFHLENMCTALEYTFPLLILIEVDYII